MPRSIEEHALMQDSVSPCSEDCEARQQRAVAVSIEP